MRSLLAVLRRNLIAVIAVVAVVAIIALGVTRPGPISAIFSSSPSSAHQTRGCDSDRGADRSDGKDQGRVPSQGCPPCPQQVGYAGECDGDNDSDDR